MNKKEQLVSFKKSQHDENALKALNSELKTAY
jgi:hypothetical protein